MSGSSDPLLVDISNAFYTGNYQQCITLAEKIKVCGIIFSCFMFLHVFTFLETQPGERHFHVPLVPSHEPLSRGAR